MLVGVEDDDRLEQESSGDDTVEDRPAAAAPPGIPPLAYDAETAAEQLGNVPTKAIYRLIESGRLKFIQIGRKYIIPRCELVRLLEEAEFKCRAEEAR